jgi:hypothetical protein
MSKGRIQELAWWEVVMSRMLAQAKGALHLPRIASWLGAITAIYMWYLWKAKGSLNASDIEKIPVICDKKL